MRRLLALVLLVPGLASADGSLREDFAALPDEPSWSWHRWEKPDATAAIEDGRLQLLFGRSEHESSVAFPRVAAGGHRRIEARFTLAMEGQVEGACFALLPTSRHGLDGPAWNPGPPRRTPEETRRPPSWAEPNLPGTLALGIDLRDPVDEDWFNENGNILDRPQRQLSLHWDGREVANVLSPVELGGGAPVEFELAVDFVTGGAEVSVAVNGESAYDRYFVAHVLPHETRACVAAHGKGVAFLDEVHADWKRPAAHSPVPIVVQAARDAWCKPGDSTRSVLVDLPAVAAEAERIVLTLTYDGGIERDYWDRNATVRILDESGEAHEIARVITPFMRWKRRYRYDVDVTDFAPLLRGTRRMEIFAGANVGDGFAIDADLVFYRRPKDVPALPRTIAIEKLWSGTANFQQVGAVAAFFDERRVRVPRGAKSAFVRIVVTGHGQMEFRPNERVLLVDAEEHRDPLWVEDCWLNPHRFQFGTWKFDRAGWCPGALAFAWEIDVTPRLRAGARELVLDYGAEPFLAESWANHWVEAHVIFQR